MKIEYIEDKAFHEIVYQSSGPRGNIRRCVLPFYKAWVDRLPEAVSAMLVTSDLQGREIGKGNRLLGEQVSEELSLLRDLGEIPSIDLVMLAGDLYDYPDCRKLGGTGDVTPVYNAFAENFASVIAVHGNHDQVEQQNLADNITILDGASIKFHSLTIGGVSGIVGRLDRNQRKQESEFKKALQQVTTEQHDILLLHQGPDDPVGEQMGEPFIREIFERRGSALVFFGHCEWATPLVSMGNNQLLNVDGKVYLLCQA